METQENLEQLIDELEPGEWFIISVEGKPKVKVVALTDEEIERLAEQKI
jgi:antitoxin (DNA-binding transcriptional repressor) of toxin-antitoxin stability system